MDYTTVERVKAALQIKVATDDALLQMIVTEASRAVDSFCTGVADGSQIDYFKLENVTDEILSGQADASGAIICYPHKPIIEAVTGFAYRENITKQESSVDPTRIEVTGMKVKAYPDSMIVPYPSRCRVRISYNGGFSGSAAGLPPDFSEIVTLLAARFYREEESALSDAIGVAELSQLVYTKAFPVRVLQQLQPYTRRVGWRYVA